MESSRNPLGVGLKAINDATNVDASTDNITLTILSMYSYLDDVIDLLQYLSRDSRQLFRGDRAKELREKIAKSRFHPSSLGLPNQLEPPNTKTGISISLTVNKGTTK